MDAWVLVHHIGLVAFLLVHGISVGVAIRLRREREPERVRALLDLSFGAVGVVHLSLLVLLAGGIGAGIVGHFFDEGWIWASLSLLVAMWGAMSFLGTRHYDRVRLAVGLKPFYGKVEPGPPAPPEELEALLSSSRPWLLVGIGVASLVVILWLMVYQPF